MDSKFAGAGAVNRDDLGGSAGGTDEGAVADSPATVDEAGDEYERPEDDFNENVTFGGVTRLAGEPTLEAVLGFHFFFFLVELRVCLAFFPRL